MELSKRLGLGFMLSRTRAKGEGNPGECLLVAGRRLGLIEVAIEAVFGDAKELTGALARLGNEEGAATVEVANGANALVFGHKGRGLAHKLLALVQQVLEQVTDVFGNGLGLGIARAAGAGKGVERTLKSFMSVMSKLMPRMPTGLPSSLRIKIVDDLSSLPSVVLVRYGSRSCTSVAPSCMDSNTIWLGPSPSLRPLTWPFFDHHVEWSTSSVSRSWTTLRSWGQIGAPGRVQGAYKTQSVTGSWVPS